MDTHIIEDLSQEKREQLFRLAQRNGVLKWLMGTVLIGILGWLSTTYFQNREARLADLKFQHEEKIQTLEFERQYLSSYLEYALDDDIKKRLRFAHYFKTLVTDSGRSEVWNVYYDDLLQASLPKGVTEATIGESVGGIEALGSKRLVKQIWLGAEADVSIDAIRTHDLSLGFLDVGMHYFVQRDGKVSVGRDIEKTPAFAKRFNTGSIAIGLACDSILAPVTRPEPGPQCNITPAQSEAAAELIANVLEEYDLQTSSVAKRSTVRPFPDLLEKGFAQIMNKVETLSKE